MANERYKNTAAAVIRRHVGNHAVTVEHVAQETGISARKVYALRDGSQQPNATDIGLLTEVLGPEFLQELFQPAGVTEVVMEQAPLANGHVVLTHACDLSSQLSHALEDGRIDHQERAQLAPKCRKAITMLRAFVAGSANVRRAAE
jgi:hypothetical protein